ncbi:MAG: carboxymuconolactone decarboxylase family protein [bacterium]
MSRIASKPDSHYAWWLRLFFRSQKKRYGQTLEPAKIWARVPQLFLGVATLYGALDRRSSPIDPVLRALITVRVSQINWCRFCVDINSATVLRRGASADKLRGLEHFRGSPLFTEKEKTALAYAEAITYSDRQVTDELFAEVRRHFSEDEIVDLTGLIAFQNLSSQFNAALDVTPQGFCHIAPQPQAASSPGSTS